METNRAPSNYPNRAETRSPVISSPNVEITEVILDVPNMGNLDALIDLNSKPKDFNTY